jgi:hypothetical protein
MPIETEIMFPLESILATLTNVFLFSRILSGKMRLIFHSFLMLLCCKGRVLSDNYAYLYFYFIL